MAKKEGFKNLKLDAIRIDGGTQLRDLDTDYVAELAAAIERQPGVLPKVIVFFDGKHHWLADGFHRYHAHRKVEAKDIASDIRKGTQRDAVLYACGSNARHGKPRSSDDKRRAVELLLKDKEWGTKSIAWIAERCVVSHAFATKINEDLERETGKVRPVVRETSNGRMMNTANIGKAKQKEREADGPAQDRPEPAKPKPLAKVEADKPTLPSDTPVFDDILNLLTQLTAKVHEVAGDGKSRTPTKAGFWLAQHLQKVETDIKNLRNIIRFTKPFQICPYCQGRDVACGGCNNQRFVIEQTWEAAPADKKAKVAA